MENWQVHMILNEAHVFICILTNSYGIIITETFALILSC